MYDPDSPDSRIRAAARAELRQAEMVASWKREANAGPRPDTGLYGKDAREFREFLGTVGDFLSTLRDAIVIWRARGGPRD